MSSKDRAKERVHPSFSNRGGVLKEQNRTLNYEHTLQTSLTNVSIKILFLENISCLTKC